MTQANGSSHLDRLETLAETILLAIQQQSQQQQALVDQQERDRQEFRASVQDVVGMIGTIAGAVQEMQAEVRGLQTENRCILERLERHMSNGHGE